MTKSQATDRRGREKREGEREREGGRERRHGERERREGKREEGKERGEKGGERGEKGKKREERRGRREEGKPDASLGPYGFLTAVLPTHPLLQYEGSLYRGRALQGPEGSAPAAPLQAFGKTFLSAEHCKVFVHVVWRGAMHN